MPPPKPAVTRLPPPPTTLLEAVRQAIDRMTWLGPTDQGMVALALEYARQIEDADDPKTVGWMGPHLANALKSLGGTPADRAALGVEEKIRGRLAELRAAR